MKKYLLFFILIYLTFTGTLYASEFTTTGFIPGQIWYSTDPLVLGSTVKVYTAVWNNTSTPLSTNVEFYDGKVLLGTKYIVVPSLQLKEASISWKVTAGDHAISAKIISPSITTSGKKKNIILNRISTETDKKSISVTLDKTAGTSAEDSNIIKSQIDKAASSLDNIVPESISAPVTKNVGFIDSFRADTQENILKTKLEAEKRVEEFNKADATTTDLVVNQTKKIGISDATDRPITYLKLFFFTILSFIFGSKVVFYLLIILILFFISRGIYRKIRNR
jgi:hypothetical protein